MTGVIYIGPLTAHHPNHQMSSITPSLPHTMYNTLFKQFTNILFLINSISSPKSSTRGQRFTIYILHYYISFLNNTWKPLPLPILEGPKHQRKSQVKVKV